MERHRDLECRGGKGVVSDLSETIPHLWLACVGLQSGFSKNKLAAQTLLFEQGGMKQ